jgi:hypothetical protein
LPAALSFRFFLTGACCASFNAAHRLGGSPPADDGPGVKEWCINSAAIDPATRSVLANSEDGNLYRWDLTTNRLAERVALTAGVGEAYTPTTIGPDGTVFAINNAILFAVGQ